MLQTLIESDTRLFLLLNGLHAAWLDPIMYLISEKWVWIPLYGWMIYLVFRNYGKRSALMLLLVAILLVLTDQVASHLIKNLVERPRPSHEPSLQGLVHLVNGYRGGRFGFVSSHASNSFGIAVYFILVFRKKYSWLPWILIPWTLLVSYSRVYLGVHYPGDILGGFVNGGLLGLLIYFIHNQLFKRKKRHTKMGNSGPFTD